MSETNQQKHSKDGWTACCECTKGGNGDKSCSSGNKSIKWDFLGCFCGTEIIDIDAMFYLKELLNQCHNEGNGEYTLPAWFIEDIRKFLKN